MRIFDASASCAATFFSGLTATFLGEIAVLELLPPIGIASLYLFLITKINK